MNGAERKWLVAGTPPWLLIALALLVFRLPYNIEILRADIDDYRKIEEMQRVQLVVEEIEDGSSLFPVDLTEFPSIEQMSTNQMEAWIEKERQKAERRHVLLRDWLIGGACARFQAAAARALVEIEQAKWLDKGLKALLHQLIQRKKESLALKLEEFGDDELLELLRKESRLNPPKILKTEIITYLLEVDEERRKRLSANWKELEPNLFQEVHTALESGKLDRFSFNVWQLRIMLALTKPAYLIDFGVLLIPILGLLTVILPHWRGWALEKRFGLRENAVGVPEINEMQAFITKNAPRIELRLNLLRPGFAFVYPKGYWRPRLAVLGGMYALWRSDPDRARNILFHEIEHVRQGDYLLVGYGSFFARYLNWLLVGFIVLMVVTLIVGMLFSIGSAGLNLAHQGKSFGKQAVMMLSSTVSIFFLLMSKIIVPLLGIWSLELNADYGVSRERALQLEFGTTPTRLVIKALRFLGTLTHPPLWLRTWLVKRENWLRSIVRQMVFPCSFLVAILMFSLMGLFAKLPPDGLHAETLTWLLGLCQESFTRMYWLFGGMAALVLLWPHLSGYWEQFFAGEGRRYRRWDGGRCVAALFLGTFAALAWWLHLST